MSGEKTSPFDAKFAQLVKETLDKWHVPGLSIAVVDGDDVWAEGYGIAKYPDTPVTSSTLFYAGSTTKAFTAAAVSLLIDNSTKYQNIAWSTPISSLIRDDFVLSDEYATTHTTIEDALSHRSGLPRHDQSYGEKYDGHDGGPKDVVRSLRHLPLTAEPRTKFQYCNAMFMTVAHLVETLTGVWLGDFLKERIWEPLGMKSTYFSTADAEKAPEFLAQGYIYNQPKDTYHPVPAMDLRITSGAGAVVSNVLDYTKWLKAFLSLSGPISKEGHTELRKARTLIDQVSLFATKDSPYTGPQAYCLGWFTGVYKGYEYFEHAGGMEAFGADVLFFPALNYGLVSFGNTAMTANAVEQKLIWHLVDEKLGTPKDERFDWDKKNQDTLKEKYEKNNKAIETHYPNIPKPPLPLSLKLEKYEGTYRHPGYQNIKVELKDGKLKSDREDMVWKQRLEFKHVSGDYFMVYTDSTTAPGSVHQDVMPAEFRVGGNGVVKNLGIAFESEMGKEGRIWFERV